MQINDFSALPKKIHLKHQKPFSWSEKHNDEIWFERFEFFQCDYQAVVKINTNAIENIRRVCVRPHTTHTTQVINNFCPKFECKTANIQNPRVMSFFLFAHNEKKNNLRCFKMLVLWAKTKMQKQTTQHGYAFWHLVCCLWRTRNKATPRFAGIVKPFGRLSHRSLSLNTFYVIKPYLISKNESRFKFSSFRLK